MISSRVVLISFGLFLKLTTSQYFLHCNKLNSILLTAIEMLRLHKETWTNVFLIQCEHCTTPTHIKSKSFTISSFQVVFPIRSSRNRKRWKSTKSKLTRKPKEFHSSNICKFLFVVQMLLPEPEQILQIKTRVNVIWILFPYA